MCQYVNIHTPQNKIPDPEYQWKSISARRPEFYCWVVGRQFFFVKTLSARTLVKWIFFADNPQQKIQTNMIRTKKLTTNNPTILSNNIVGLMVVSFFFHARCTHMHKHTRPRSRTHMCTRMQKYK